MKSGYWIIALILFGLAGLTSCFATPPSVGPNLNPPPGPNNLPVGLNPADREIPLPPDESSIPADGVGGNSAPVPDTVVQSHAGAFSRDLPVTVGVIPPETPDASPPLVGPFAAPSAVLALEGERPVLEDGSVIFGIYLAPGTTPGTYTVFAQQGSIRLEAAITVFDPSTVN